MSIAIFVLACGDEDARPAGSRPRDTGMDASQSIGSDDGGQPGHAGVGGDVPNQADAAPDASRTAGGDVPDASSFDSAPDTSGLDGSVADAGVPQGGPSDAGPDDDAGDDDAGHDYGEELPLCAPIDPAPTETRPCPTTAPVPLKLTQIGVYVIAPVQITHAPDDPDERLFIVDRRGWIDVVEDGAYTLPSFFGQGVPWSYPEQGLLGLAFDPDFALNGRFFVSYTEGDSGAVDARLVVDTYTVSLSPPHVADHSTRRRVLTLEHPQPRHYGGTLAFGPDGQLYLSVGDGGNELDRDTTHGRHGNAQSLSSPLGKILRLNVGALDETTGELQPCIWDYGLRNPWRFSFDRETGDLYIGDVGQNHWEEVDIERRGHGGNNYGWRFMEGKHCTGELELAALGTSCEQQPVDAFAPPAFEYANEGNGNAVIGGHVYRGTNIPSLDGYYVFADWHTRKIWAVAWDGSQLCGPPIDLSAQLDPLLPINSFGEDSNGELYIVASSPGFSGAAAWRIDPQ